MEAYTSGCDPCGIWSGYQPMEMGWAGVHSFLHNWHYLDHPDLYGNKKTI